MHRRVMFWMILLPLFCILLSVAIPASAEETGTETRITLKLKQVDLQAVLAALFAQVPGKTYTVEPGLKLDRSIPAIEIKNVDFDDVFHFILGSENLTYRQEGNNYHIIEAKPLPKVTLSLKGTPMKEALLELFKNIPQQRYIVDEKVPLDKPVTLVVREAPFLTVLSAILDQADAFYYREDTVFNIKPRPAITPVDEESAEETAKRTREYDFTEWKNAAADKQRLLYLTRFGERWQLRARVVPYPGMEVLLWESPEVTDGVCHLLPSPSYGYLAILWGKWEGSYDLFLLNLDTAEVKKISKDSEIQYVVWKDEHTLSMLSSPRPEGGHWQESSYDTGTGTLTPGGTVFPGESGSYEQVYLDFLTPPYKKQIATLEKLAQDKEIAVPLPTRYLTNMILKGAGIPYFTTQVDAYLGANSLAAFSPDEHYLAFTSSKDAIFIISMGEHLSNIDDTIPLTSLVSHEGIFVEDLHWSPDAKWLTFTELHFHPPQPTGWDTGPRPGPLDYTYLVRLYSWKTRTTETIAVGRGAFLMPPTKKKTDQTTKGQAK